MNGQRKNDRDNSVRTSKKVASLASEELKNKGSSKNEKSVAGSDLVNRKAIVTTQQQSKK